MNSRITFVTVSARRPNNPTFLRAKLDKMAAENENVGDDVEKAKVGSSEMDPSMQMSVVSATLAISRFTPEIQGE